MSALESHRGGTVMMRAIVCFPKKSTEVMIDFLGKKKNHKLPKITLNTCVSMEIIIKLTAN
jgi:hypothetical protein